MIIFSGGQKADAVIFDFDGVIVDTEPLHYRAFQVLLEPLGFGYSWNEYVEKYMGFDDRDAFIAAFSAHGVELSGAELQALIAKKAQSFQDIIRCGVPAYPGVVSLIKQLHTNKIPLAICSGALRSDIIPILSSLDVSYCFNIIITAEDVQKSKPDPECYRLTFERLKSCFQNLALSVENTVVIEDTPAGIQAANDAGLPVIAVSNSYSFSYLSGAIDIVVSLEDLLDFQVI